MRSRLDSRLAALIILVLVALAFLMSTPWTNLAFTGVGLVVGGVVGAFARTACPAKAAAEIPPEPATVSKPSRR